jgi:glutaconate CoA-transferase, subunit A
VSDGDTVYIAGFTHAVPFGVGHEIIRQRKHDLTLCRANPDLISDQMIAAGCLRKVVFSWAGNASVGSLKVFRRAVEADQIEIEEYTHFGMSSRLFAGASGLPFFPLRTNLGSGLPAVNPRMKEITCPYTGEVLSVVPALNPDVAVIHVQRADRFGNAQMWGIVGEQREAAFAASKVIVSTEEVVDEAVIRSDPNRTLVPASIVSAVVELPWGAHPSCMQGHYDRDDEFHLEWARISETDDSVRAYLDEWVYGAADRREYIERLGAKKLVSLLPKHAYSTPVDYGMYRTKRS